MELDSDHALLSMGAGMPLEPSLDPRVYGVIEIGVQNAQEIAYGT